MTALEEICSLSEVLAMRKDKSDIERGVLLGLEIAVAIVGVEEENENKPLEDAE